MDLSADSVAQAAPGNEGLAFMSPDVAFDFFDVSQDFPRLAPDSEIGRLIIQVNGDLMVYEKSEELIRSREPDADEQREDLTQSFLPVIGRLRALFGFYENLADSVELMEANGQTAILYPELITDARKEVMHRLETSPEMAAIRPEIQDFINNLSLLYWLEADRHFQPVADGQ